MAVVIQSGPAPIRTGGGKNAEFRAAVKQLQPGQWFSVPAAVAKSSGSNLYHWSKEAGFKVQTWKTTDGTRVIYRPAAA